MTAYGRRIAFQRGASYIVRADTLNSDSDFARPGDRLRSRPWEAYLVLGILALFALVIVLHVIGGRAQGH